MNKLSCNIVRDLLPLYCDMLLEAESVVEVENHLKECPSCKDMYEKMNKDLNENCVNEKIKDVPNIQRLFRKIRIRNTIIFSILATMILFLDGAFWKVPANVVDIEEMSISTMEYTFPDKAPVYATYFNVDYSAKGIQELEVDIYQEGDTIRIVGKQSLFSVIKNDGGSLQMSGRTGYIIENAEDIKEVYFNGSLVWDVNKDGEIPKE